LLKKFYIPTNIFVFLIIIIGVFNYVFLFYGLYSRQNTVVLFINFALLFVCYFYILLCLKDYSYKKYNLLIYTSIFFRVLPILSFPLLSDDFYRFIWDGHLLQTHINPFAFTPQQLVSLLTNELPINLFTKLNSPNYYSVYPPVNQFIFWLSAFANKNNLLLSVIIMRVCLVAFDIGNIILLKKLLIIKKLKPELVFIYALNPLVIIEFAGNLHFEVVMLFFTLLSVYFLLRRKNNWSAISLGFAVCSKLLPLIFIPVMVKQIGWLKTMKYCLIVFFTTLILFVPFIYNTELLANFYSSLKLYYGNFEFNGSFYLLLKYLGWQYWGYNTLIYNSKILLLFTIVGFGYVYIKSKDIFESLFLILFIYFVFSAVVHPWYILPMVALSVFVKWRFVVVWSALIGLSYYTYRIIPYEENTALLVLEYGLLFGYLIFEVITNVKNKYKNNII